MIKSALNFKFPGNKVIELFPQGTYDFENLRNETLISADYEYLKVLSFARLDINL